MFRGVKRYCNDKVERGEGSVLWTTTGKRLLDFSSGIAVVSTGHCHPRIVEAVREQAGKVVHLQQSCVQSAVQWELVEKLQPLMPEGLDAFFFTNSGAEAVEGAMKLARQATGRDGIIAFYGGYHGRTQACLSVTTSQAGYKGNRAGPLPGSAYFVPFPYEHAGFSVEHTKAQLDMAIKMQTPASDTAAVIIEPILGEGGFVVPPQGFLTWLRKWCNDHDILMIADEVQSGAGRTGKMWAVDHEAVTPDIMTAAKGIASGYPLAAVVARSTISDQQVPGCMGGTYGGNAVACAAAIATLEVFEQEQILQNTLQRGEQLLKGLRMMSQKPKFKGVIGDIRGRGLMIAVEFSNPGFGDGFAGIAKDVSSGCLNRNMLLLNTGARETMRFAPPLVVTEAEVEESLSIFEESLTSALAVRTIVS